MCVPRISSWESFLLPKDKACTMDLRKKWEKGMHFPPDWPERICFSCSRNQWTSDGGTGPDLACCGNSGSQPRTGEQVVLGAPGYKVGLYCPGRHTKMNMHCSPGCVLVFKKKKKKGYMTPKRLRTTKSDFFPEQSDHCQSCHNLEDNRQPHQLWFRKALAACPCNQFHKKCHLMVQG